MTLAYCANALIYDAERDGYALRPDYDPGLHRVDIECCQAMGWSMQSDAGWNDPADPPIAHVRDMHGVPLHAGHAYVADRFNVTGPDSAMIRIDLLEIDHDPVGIVAGAPLEPGFVYRVANSANPYRTQEEPKVATGFGPGTMIATKQGDLPVEWLAAGDEVLTFEGAPQPLRWVGHTRLSARDLARHPKLRPVWIGEGAPARGAPGHGLCVAPDTQLLLAGAQISLNFGLDQALVQAGDLINPPPMHGNSQGLTYFMLLFDKHEVLLANGQLCASLFADAGVRDLLARQFPTFPPNIRHHRFALPCLTEWEAGMIRAGQIFGKPQRLVVAA